jgi:hypothetical protein
MNNLPIGVSQLFSLPAGSEKKQLLVDKADDDLVVAYDALDDYDFM